MWSWSHPRDLSGVRFAPPASMQIQPLDAKYAPQTIALLQDLRLSLFGISSRRVYTALVNDGVQGRIDCRVAAESSGLLGVVLAAPASYWRSTLLKHWDIAVECLRTRISSRLSGAFRLRQGSGQISPHQRGTTVFCLDADAGTPPRTWNEPGDAWRIIFIGTTAVARGQGVAAKLYRSLMADRSLVARIALDNAPSIRLHQSLGWRLYPDAGVALAVHLRDWPCSEAPPETASQAHAQEPASSVTTRALEDV
jgi:hypothetical protein